jgi:hypothetical protein
MSAEHFTRSSYRERLLEHVFIGDLLRRLWVLGYRDAEVLKPEVDQSGYDVVLECGGISRHVQLKASHDVSKTAKVSVHVGLADKPSGCVLWILFDEKTLHLGPFLWFGGAPGEKLPDISGLKVGRRTTPNSTGQNPERPNIRCLPKPKFEKIQDFDGVIKRLFGIGGQQGS